VYEFADGNGNPDEDAYVACDFTGLTKLPRTILADGTKIPFGTRPVRYFGGKGGPGGDDENTFCLDGQKIKLEGQTTEFPGPVGDTIIVAWPDPQEWPINKGNAIRGLAPSNTVTFEYPAGTIPAPDPWPPTPVVDSITG